MRGKFLGIELALSFTSLVTQALDERGERSSGDDLRCAPP
jgi:hypothetical protein